ncbi:hypothetical protein L3X38_031957 [Prunus dulcis]|uniref:Uncharacterized protein n=1 Tax=Prunus dulcis TaxID=3755 RepID=A0AAD4YVF8_PRUDU|nr:hypothetical protein L3X38_031957 [Prunus dulcis]
MPPSFCMARGAMEEVPVVTSQSRASLRLERVAVRAGLFATGQNCFNSFFFFVPRTRKSLSQGDHVWSTDMLEVSGRWEGEVGNENAIRKKLDLDPNMTKIKQALNIPVQFHKWRCEHWKEVGGLLLTKDIERWKLHGSDLNDLPAEQEESSIELLEERKASGRSAKDEVLVSR